MVIIWRLALKRPLSLALVVAGITLFASNPAQSDLDPDHSPKVLILAGSPSLPAKLALLRRVGESNGVVVDTIFVSGRGPDELGQSFRNYDAVLLDYVWIRGLQGWAPAFQKYLQQHPGIVFPGLFYEEAEWYRGISADQSRMLFEYYDNGGAENFARMFRYLKSELLKISDEPVLPPVVLPLQGIYHPDAERIFPDVDAYFEWRQPEPEARFVGIKLQRRLLQEELTQHIDDLIRRVEMEERIVPIPYYHEIFDPARPVTYRRNPDRRFAADQDPDVQEEMVPAFDVSVALVPPRSGPKTMHTELEEIGGVRINGLVDSTQTVDEWYADEMGWPMVRMGPWIVNAEIAGLIDPIVIAAKSADGALISIPEQMDALVERVKNYLALRHKPNSEKRVAFFVWNGSDDEDNFTASYLNIPDSLITTFAALRDAGYRIDEVTEKELTAALKMLIKPYYRTDTDFALRQLLSEGLAVKVPLEDYESWLGTLHHSIREQLSEHWPEIADNYLTIREGQEVFYVIPRLELGNVLVLPQPLRGDRRDLESDLRHDKAMPLHHAYRAVYYHVVHDDPVDAIVHFGTHGTQEWTSGKERAQWVFDDTQTTVGNIPVVYPYSVAAVGEGLIAKRRGRAVVISHNTPPFAPAGLYGEMVPMHELMHEIQEMEEGQVKENTKQELVALVVKLDIDKDLGISEADVWADWDNFYDEIHEYMEGLAGALQPLGLHTFGTVAEADHVLLSVMQMIEPEYMDLVDPDHGSRVLLEDYSELTLTPAFLTLKAFLVDGQALESFDAGLHPYLLDARKHWQNFRSEQEIEHFLDALEARFIPTGNGNDPIRNPQAIPTGKNTYAFDPARIPTKAAWDAGVELADSLIENYRASKGLYPDKLTFSLWSTETLKHSGVVEAEILYLLGVKPVWNRAGQVKDVEVIPARALGRPRIDMVMSVTSLYRDNLPEVMSILQKAVSSVAALDEQNNYVRQNVKALETRLQAAGLNAEEARRYAEVRVFSSESGSYGSGLPEFTLASGSWEGDAEMAAHYLSRMGYMYGNDDQTRNQKLENFDLYAENLRGTKAAILSRSSNSQGVLSTDHAFEYLGGISLAVRNLTGETPEMLISDLRNTRDFSTKNLSQFLSQEARSRFQHPRWINEMKNEGYSGALEMTDAINNFWGWNVTAPGVVRDDQWQEFFEIYVEDKLGIGLEEFFREANPAALAKIAERMLEAKRKDYWDAPEEVVRRLVELYLDLIAKNNIDTTNEVFKEYVETTAAGFGLEIPRSMAEVIELAGLPEIVEGMMLEQVTPEELEHVIRWWTYLVLLLFVVFGGGYEWWRGRRHMFVLS